MAAEYELLTLQATWQESAGIQSDLKPPFGIKDYVVDIWEARKIKLYGDDSSQSQSSTGDLGEFTGIERQSGKNMCQGGKPDTGKFHSSYIGIWMYVAPPMRMGTWSMALVLRQRIEYYIYIAHTNIGAKMRKIKIENSYRQKKLAMSVALAFWTLSRRQPWA